MRRQSANGLRFALYGVFGVLLLAVPGLRGQVKVQVVPAPPGQLIPPDERSDPSLQPRADIDKDLSKALAKAEEYRDRGNFESAVEIVQRYALDQKKDREGKPSSDRSADYFTDQTMKTSLKREALRLIGELPEEGRRIYELKFGELARAMLQEAIAASNTTQLEQITRQYFHTKAGYEATYLIATHKLDQGEPLAAAMHFEQLRGLPDGGRNWEPMLSLKSAVAWFRAGETDRAVEIVTALKNQTPAGRLSVGARTVSLFANDDDAEGWLARLVGQPVGAVRSGPQQWTMFRGNAARNAGSSPSSPAWDSAWEFTTVRDPEADLALPPEDPERLAAINDQLRKMEETRKSDGFLTMPAAHPLVIGDSVVFRTMRNVRAVDIKTGELRWETRTSQIYWDLVATDSARGAVRVNNQATVLETLLAQRAWRDLAAGTLSSDGRYVYSLEAMGLQTPSNRRFRGVRLPTSPSQSSKLVAYDLVTDGKIVWEVGGARDDGLPLAGTFFLGPPLPLDGHLYCIAEVTGDVRLVVLNAQTAEFEWSQTLALPDAAVSVYPIRRLAGLSPAFSDGVLVCPTTSGAVVAIDPARRILLWGRRYARSDTGLPKDPRQAMLMRARGMVMMSGTDDESRWVDSAPTIADGRILLTPRDSNDLTCLNLVDGSVAWKVPRGQSLYLATVYEGKVVLVGRSQIHALELATGKPVWDEPISIESPTGRGVRDLHIYRVPLSTGEIASIDLNTGRIVARSKSRSGQIFGNLAVAEGTIVSQSIDKLIGFKSLAELREQTDGVLARKPDDAKALALRGEMRLHAGDEAGGLADLRHSIAQESTLRSRTLVVATMLEGLRTDFRKYSPHADEIEKLVEDPRQRGQYLRLHAAGLHKLGDQQAAFREYLKLAGSDTGKPELERVSASLSVRSDRWIRPRIVEVYRKSSGQQRTVLDREIDDLLASAANKEDATSSLRRFLDAFVDLPVGDEAGRLLANHLDIHKEALADELLLRRLRRSDDRQISGFATAKLAALYIEHKRSRAASLLLDELATDWNDVVCLDEKTGRQLVEEWRADSNVAKLLESQAAWPQEKIEAKEETRRSTIQQKYPVRIIGSRGPLGEGLTLALDSRRQTLLARDANGKELWKLKTGGLRANISHPYGNYARVNGHLLIVVFGTHFAVLDGFQQKDGAPRVLWQANLIAGTNGNSRNLQAQFRQIVGPGGVRIMTVQDRFGRPIGKVVPIFDSMICYQMGTRLIAADAITGETLWERRSVSRGSEIFGDREYVFVAAPNSKDAIVLRAADGEQVATRPLPKEGTQLSIEGRHVIMWTGRAVQKIDMWNGSTLWEKRFPPASKAIAMEGGRSAVAVLNQHQGSFAILDTDDGRLIVDSAIEPDAGIDSFLVHRCRGEYVLLTHSIPKQANAARVMALNYNHPLVNGYVYAFDRKSGKKIWATRVENQAFDVDQPPGLPVLIFTARTYRQLQGRFGANRNQYAVSIIDKRNGRPIYSKSDRKSLSQFAVVADPVKRTLAVSFYTTLLTLKLTKEPLAAPAQAKKPVAIPDGK